MSFHRARRMCAFVDGAAEPTNPGPMGAGYVLWGNDGELIEAMGHYWGWGSNNTAEYMALIMAAEAAVSYGATALDVKSDSQLVVKQVHGQWRVHQEHLRPLHEKALKLLNGIGPWTLKWIPREQNEQANLYAAIAASYCVTCTEESGELVLLSSRDRISWRHLPGRDDILPQAHRLERPTEGEGDEPYV
jgi:ribonuclease HI